MSWMGWTMIGVMAFALVFCLIIVAVSFLEGWRWRRK